jgi:hypothetical protein
MPLRTASEAAGAQAHAAYTRLDGATLPAKRRGAVVEIDPAQLPSHNTTELRQAPSSGHLFEKAGVLGAGDGGEVGEARELGSSE